MMKRYFLFLTLILLAGCQTNPPDPDYTISETGRVYLSSNADPAEIYIDNNPSGRLTPDTITIPAGQHLVSLVKNGYARKDTTLNITANSFNAIQLNLQAAASRLVLVEDFANVSCDPCVISNIIIHSLSSYTYKDKIAVIKYPTYWPGANDPFYLAAKPESDSRINYYRVVTAPTVIVNGTQKPVPSDSTKIKTAVDAELDKAPKFKMEVEKSLTGDLLHVHINVTIKDSSGLDFDELVLQTVVVESDIEFSSPPGGNGETKFYHVMRSMLPSSDGEIIENSDKMYERSVICKPVWNKEKLHVIAFIQNKTTKEVFQAGIN